jgi:phosphoglycolate phosphatase-like HAD superfamily hydrolase
MPLCFDLDGTLGTFGGGYALLREALGTLWGEAPTRDELRACAGSTDWEIVDELHRLRFGAPLPLAAYEAFEVACLGRFEAAFHPEVQAPVAFGGILEGMHLLRDRGHRVWLVSGNTPRTLAFKAARLGIDAAIPRLGSLPGLSRADLIAMALEGCAGPHLYVGDRPHDRDAAREAGVPFLGIGDAVEGPHPVLEAEAEAAHLMAVVEALVGPAQFPMLGS